VTPEGHAEAKAFGFKRLKEIEDTLAKFHDRIELATKASDAERLDKAGKRFAFISIENSYPLGEDLTLLEQFYKRGVRMASPVHFRNNALADSATDPQPKWGGFSPLGKRWVAEMNRLGMVVDLSHSSDQVLEQAIALSRTPVILSHSGSKAIFDHPRNVGDDLVRKLAASGGAICVNSIYISPSAPNPELRPLLEKAETMWSMPATERAALMAQIRTVQAKVASTSDFDTYMRNVLHLIEVAGVDHVCFGADWDGGGGVPGMEDIDSLPKVTERLRAAGYSEADLQKMWSGNVLRLVRIADERKTR
jgi:membrane dipeptidase